MMDFMWVWLALCTMCLLLLLIYLLLKEIYKLLVQLKDTVVAMKVLVDLMAQPTLNDLPEDIDEWNAAMALRQR